MSTSVIRGFVGDIRFWILLSFIVRLYHITNPPLEVAHNWRQTTVTMPARNFFETGADVFHPTIDFAGDKTGITGMEFPFLNYLIYLVSMVFGYEHWYGRLINLIASCIGLFYFSKLISKYFNVRVAFNSTFILIFSLWFSYSRKIMPDTFSVSFAIIGLFYATEFFDKKASVKNLAFYLIFALMGVLSKLPSGIILTPLIIFIVDKKISFSKKVIFFGVSLVLITPVVFWYFYWVPELTRVYDFYHFFMGKNFSEGFIEIIHNYNLALEKFYCQALGYSGFIAFLCCTINLIKKKEKTLSVILFISSISFAVIILKAGSTFCRHSYYIIPFVPIMALVCGAIISTITNKRLVITILAVIAIECVLTSNADFYIKEQNYAILNLENDLDKVSKRNDLILINSDETPTPMYFAHRKGWINKSEIISDSNYINNLHLKGLKYIVILKRVFGTDVSLKYKKIFSNQDYTFYEID